ncbi:MAG TPA: methyltransferase domain-containing protein, partial [Acidimicrobiia bacterium]|nr:methyltransferase domain-containing protein [Acidimicrobiia bacterium]
MTDDTGQRARSFGSIAEDYERWRPGVDPAVAEWFVPEPIGRAIDVGAGTGKLSRLLLERAAEVVCVEPDDRMRAVLARQVPEATVLDGAGERIPVDDGSADAVLVSSAWHWMDHAAAAAEVARVLRPGGTLGVVWSGIDWTAEW